LISTACSWVSILGGQKAAILAQVGHFYSDDVGQYYSGANRNASVRCVPSKKRTAQIRHSSEKRKGSHRCKPLIVWLRGCDTRNGITGKSKAIHSHRAASSECDAR
jgi:hypothetical protein